MKLSIIIPTKDRGRYCISAIRQILSLGLADMELIIQDNSTKDDLRNEIERLQSDQIVYNYHSGVLSFVDNFSEPLSFAKGDYICMIGDDDGILPDIMDVVNRAITEDIDAIIPSLDATYIWPSEKSIIHGAESGCLFYGNYSCKSEYVDIEKGLRQLLNKAGQDYQSQNIPRLYHGIVKRERIEDIRKRSGSYFEGLTPDIYMSVALCFVCKKVLRLKFPVTISGICPRSGSSDSVTGKHTGELKDAPHFKGHINYVWDEKAPYIYSVESIWGETVLHALKKWYKDAYYDMFRVDVLDANCYSKYPQFRKRLLEHARKYNYHPFWIRYLAVHFLIKYKVAKYGNAILNRISGKQHHFHKVHGIVNISQACCEIEKIRNYK